MSAQLLMTKLFAPMRRANLVTRDALIQRLLVMGQPNRLTLVSAPAGFGKSTLMTELAAATNWSSAWLSLDPADSDPRRFLQYLVAAVQRAVPESMTDSQSLLASKELPIDERLMTLLLNEFALLPQPLLIQLDDYHLIDSVSETDSAFASVDAVLAFLIEQLPPHISLVIASREDPALPLARLRVRGQLSEVRAVDLRFSRHEAQRFFSDTMQLALDSQELAALERRTEGWVAGLQLAALSLQHQGDRGGFIEDFTGSHRFVLDYLAEEVLHQLPAETRRFLLHTSILERFDQSLAEAVTGTANAGEILRWLEQNNLFLVPLDNQRQWYRYHHLFGEVLRTQAQFSTEHHQRLHRLASDWFHDRNQPEEAIDYACRGQDWQRAAYLLECHWPMMRLYATEQSLLDWMAQLPLACWDHRPVLVAHYGFILLSFDYERGKSLLQQAKHQVTSEPSGVQIDNPEAYRSLPGMLAVADVYSAGVEGRDDILSLCREALEIVPEDDMIWRGSIAAMYGLTYWGAGELDEAMRAVVESQRLMEASGDTSAVLAVWHLMTDLRLQQGRLDEASVINQKALDFQAQLKPPWVQACADTWVIRAELALEHNQPAQAQRYLEQADAMGITAQLPQMMHRAPLLRARLAAASATTQNVAYIAEQLELAARLHMEGPSPNIQPVPAWQARLWLQQGHRRRAREWADVSGIEERIHQAGPCYIHEFEFLTLVQLQLSEIRQPLSDMAGSSADAPELNTQPRTQPHAQLHTIHQQLDTWLELARTQNRLASQLDILLLQIECRTLVEESGLGGGEAVGHQAPGQPLLQPLLQQARQLSQETGLLRRAAYLEQESAEQEICTASNRDSKALFEPLSSRELDVLKLLDSDLTGPQIAERLFVSLNTFRTHSKNIYSKLAVKTRRAAIDRARALGLI